MVNGFHGMLRLESVRDVVILHGRNYVGWEYWQSLHTCSL